MNHSNANIVVLGSLNMDLVTETERDPYPGETIKSKLFRTSPGGKGNNQAVAISKLGGHVDFAGCVGNDQYGEQLLDNLIVNNVDPRHIKRLNDVFTGMAFINVFNGQNTIILYEGANGYCTVERMEYCEELIKKAKILLMQLEIPFETVKWAARIAKANNTLVILNPAPAVVPDKEIYKDIDVLVPNEVEAQQLSDIKIKHDNDYSLIINKFKSLGVSNVIITLGDKGVLYGENYIKAYKVEALDSTGAGDAFIGGLCYALSCDMLIKDAIGYANAVAAISVTRIGAQSALPDNEEVKHFISNY